MRERSLRQSILVTVIVTLTFTIGTGIYFTFIYKMVDLFSSQTADLFAECVCYIAQAIGMLLSAILVRKKVRFVGGRFFFPITVLLSVLLAFPCFLSGPSSVTVVLYVVTSIIEGMTQGLYFLLLTTLIPKDRRLVVFGISYALSPIITALLSLIDGGEFVKSIYAVVLYLVLAIAVCVAWQSVVPVYPAEGSPKLVNTTAKVANPKKAVVIATLLFIAISWAIQSVGFYFPMAQSDELNISGEILRITYSTGLIVAAFLNNKDKRIGAICCLVTMTTPMLYILLQTKVGVTAFVFFVSYFMTGFLAIYRYGIIADLSDMMSPKGYPLVFLCSFGLIFGRFGEAFGAFIGIKLGSDPLALMAVTSVLLVLGSGMFMFHYMRLFTPVPASEMTREDVLTSIKLRYDLSSREMDVLNLLVDGATNTEISSKLFISENTVKFHVSNLLKKTGTKSRKELSSVFLESFSKK